MKADIKPENHPYMKVLEAQLKAAEEKKELLEIRVKLLTEKFFKENNTQLEAVEAKLTIIKSRSEISALDRVIKEKRAYFMKFVQGFIEDMEEIEGNFNNVKNAAYKQSETDPEMKAILAKIVWEGLEKDAEAKIYCYKQLKKRLNVNA